jgi:multisubunit Na+/H+ antiporter MnhG subunit
MIITQKYQFPTKMIPIPIGSIITYHSGIKMSVFEDQIIMPTMFKCVSGGVLSQRLGRASYHRDIIECKRFISPRYSIIDIQYPTEWTLC